MLITERERTGRSWKRGLASRLLQPGLEQAPAGGGGEQTPLSSQKSPSLQLPLARGGRALPEEGEELQLLAAKPWLCCSCGWQGAPSSLHPRAHHSRGDERNLGIPRRSGPGIPQGLFWWARSAPGTLRRGWSRIPFPHPEQHPGCSRGCSRAFPVGSKAGAGCWAQFLPKFLLWGHGPGAGVSGRGREGVFRLGSALPGEERALWGCQGSGERGGQLPGLLEGSGQTSPPGFRIRAGIWQPLGQRGEALALLLCQQRDRGVPSGTSLGWRRCHRDLPGDTGSEGGTGSSALPTFHLRFLGKGGDNPAKVTSVELWGRERDRWIFGGGEALGCPRGVRGARDVPAGLFVRP